MIQQEAYLAAMGIVIWRERAVLPKQKLLSYFVHQMQWILSDEPLSPQENALFYSMIRAFNFPELPLVYTSFTLQGFPPQAVVIVFGQASATHLLGEQKSIEEWRAHNPQPQYAPQKVIVTYGFCDMIRKAALKKPVWQDLKPWIMTYPSTAK